MTTNTSSSNSKLRTKSIQHLVQRTICHAPFNWLFPAREYYSVSLVGSRGNTLLPTALALDTSFMNLEFNGKIWYWRGPAPHYFVTVPTEQSNDLKAIVTLVTYGWGMIPVNVQIGQTEWKTSLFPKNGGYIVPIKASVQKAENLHEGDQVTLYLKILL